MEGMRVVRSRKPYEGKIFSVVLDEVEDASGRRATREIARHPGGSVIVPILADGRVILVRQYRYPFGEYVLELPAGRLSPGEEPEACAHRELLEETGQDAQSMTPLGHIYTSPGFLDERLYLFLATGLEPSALGQQLDEGEETLTVELMPFQRALEMIRLGQIVDAKTICGILMATEHLPPSRGR